MKKGYLYIVFATIFFTSFEVVLKFIAGQINSVQLTFWRFSIGFLFLMPLAIRTLKKRNKQLDRKTVSYFALLGFLGISICMPVLHMAVNYTDSAVVAVLFSCNPVFVAVLAFFLLGEPIYPRHIAALVLEILGTIVLINPLNTTLNPFGILLTLISTALFSVYGVLGKKKCAEYGGAVVTCFSFFFGSLIIFLFILLTHTAPVSSLMTNLGLPLFSNIPIVSGLNARTIPVVLYVAIGVAGLGFFTYFMAMEYQPASVVSLIYFFKPALSPILAWSVHREQITSNMKLGIVLIVTGSLCAIIPGILEAKRAKH